MENVLILLSQLGRILDVVGYAPLNDSHIKILA